MSMEMIGAGSVVVGLVGLFVGRVGLRSARQPWSKNVRRSSRLDARLLAAGLRYWNEGAATRR